MTTTAVVCGAGIAGLTAAWWLERAGWDVVVVEHAPGPRGAGYMIDFFGPGFEVADRMGLVPRLRRVGADIAALQYVDARGRRRGGADYAEFAGAVDGRLVSLPRGELAAALREAALDGVSTRWGTTVDSVEEDPADVDGPVEVRLSDGSTVVADLVVGADGLHSRIREMVVAPGEDAIRPLGFHTAAYLLRDDVLRAALGDRMLVVAEPDHQMALYPMGDGSLATWLVHRTDAARLPDDPVSVLHRVYADLGDGVVRALEHCTEQTDLYYDVVAQVHTRRWSHGRTVLVGDACHAPSLMAGQGASLAMTGAWLLVRELARGGTVPGALDRYVAAMRPVAERTQARGRATARWLVPSSRVGLVTRQLVLGLVGLPGAGPLLRAALGAQRGEGLPADA